MTLTNHLIVQKSLNVFSKSFSYIHHRYFHTAYCMKCVTVDNVFFIATQFKCVNKPNVVHAYNAVYEKHNTS